MPVDFYYLSGSPFSWRVWLALEHKQIPYRLHVLFPDDGDLKGSIFTAINPHQKAPALVDGDLALFESGVIVDYLEEKYPIQGSRLWPKNIVERAYARRVAAQASSYLYPPVRKIVVEILFRRDGFPDLQLVSDGKQEINAQLALLQKSFKGDFIAGSAITAADFAVYPCW